MKKSLLLIMLMSVLSVSLTAAASCKMEHFYTSIPNVSGYELKTKLFSLLSRTHRKISYDDLHKAYKKIDRDQFYDADGTIMDMYSENPVGSDPYNFQPGQKQCGKATKESSCYNREHLFPQGLFGKGGPMKTDIFHVYPTDGKVNNRRNSFPFGEVAEAKWESQNGSKLGSSRSRGYEGRVFEPIDEFKGDIARALLYFAVRYENRIPNFKNNPMTDGSREQTYSTWFLDVLLKWHKQDPVGDHERFRNDAACEYQKNRNPFIDHPEWVSAIWESK